MAFSYTSSSHSVFVPTRQEHVTVGYIMAKKSNVRARLVSSPGFSMIPVTLFRQRQDIRPENTIAIEKPVSRQIHDRLERPKQRWQAYRDPSHRLHLLLIMHNLESEMKLKGSHQPSHADYAETIVTDGRGNVIFEILSLF